MDFICPKCQTSFALPEKESLGQFTCPHCEENIALASLETKAFEPLTISPEEEYRDLSLQRLGEDLEILHLIGRGGMGSVYRARQISLEREVAVKILPPHLAEDEQFVQRFHREAATLASLDHHHIVKIISKGEDRERGIYYFVMELIEGKSLARHLEVSKVEEKEKIRILKEVGEALDFAHNRGVVHRDIKPANILIGRDGKVKVSDFGVARIIGTPGSVLTELTVTHMVVGTLKYMAPEQRNDSKGVDQRADIYSLGVMVYEMFTGKEPAGRFDLPSQIDPEIDPRLDYVVEKALHPDREKRFSSVREMVRLLEEMESSPPDTSPTHMERKEETAMALAGEGQKGVRGGAVFALLFILLFVNLGALGYYFWQNSGAGKVVSKNSKGKGANPKSKLKGKKGKSPDEKKKDKESNPGRKGPLQTKNTPNPELFPKNNRSHKESTSSVFSSLPAAYNHLEEFRRNSGQKGFFSPLPPGAKKKNYSWDKMAKKDWEKLSFYDLSLGAKKLEMAGEKERARQVYRFLKERKVDKFYDYYYRAVACIQLGNYQKGRSDLVEYLGKSQKIHQKFFYLFLWQEQMTPFGKKESQNWDKLWKQWAFLSHLNCLAHSYLSWTWKIEKKWKRALGEIGRALFWAKNLHSFYRNSSYNRDSYLSTLQGGIQFERGNIHFLLGQFNKASRDYEESARVYKKNAFLYIHWILLAFQSGKPQEGDKILALSQKIFPPSEHGQWNHFLQGLIAHLKEDLPRAEVHYQKALEGETPNRGLYHLFAALLRFQKGRDIDQLKLPKPSPFYYPHTGRYLPSHWRKDWNRITSG